jgi:opacity protein-like surface antigen
MKTIVAAFLLAASFAAVAEIPNHHWQIGTGPGYVSGLNTNDLTASWRVGYGWQMPGNFEMAVIADWAHSTQSTDMRYFTVALSGDYNFSDENISPYVTADLGYGDVHVAWECTGAECESPNDDAAGAALGVGVGYKFFRNSCVQVGVLARYDVVFVNTRRGTPMKTALQGVLDF